MGASFFDIALRVIVAAIKSPTVHAAAKHVMRQATAAVIRDIRRRQAISRRTRMHIS